MREPSWSLGWALTVKPSFTSSSPLAFMIVSHKVEIWHSLLLVGIRTLIFMIDKKIRVLKRLKEYKVKKWPYTAHRAVVRSVSSY